MPTSARGHVSKTLYQSAYLASLPSSATVEERSTCRFSESELSKRTVLALVMTVFTPMAHACGHYGSYPSSQTALLDTPHSLHFSSHLQRPTFNHSDLTSYLQFCGFHGLTANMAASQDELDIETFQRLSDTYQQDVQVRLSMTTCAVSSDLTLTGTSHSR